MKVKASVKKICRNCKIVRRFQKTSTLKYHLHIFLELVGRQRKIFVLN
ncbi:MAG: 50S ribosomal protein L36 [Proteobacteria bacterium]|nr:50S ribosomal protein L36 [Pseudomonadota bacterium]